MKASTLGVSIRGLKFAYDGAPPILRGVNLDLPQGSRTLLLGRNGVGKSTLLRILAGFHLVDPQSVRVFGRSPFHEGLGAGEMALVDGSFPLDLDIRVGELLDQSTEPASKSLESELLKMLEVSRDWRMHQVSDGERRRVQLLLALRRPVKLLLLDEITTHLDLLVRADLMAWLQHRSESSGLTIVYTTHILDGLWREGESAWATHLAFLAQGTLPHAGPVLEIPEVQERLSRGERAPLLAITEAWMRASR